MTPVSVDGWSGDELRQWSFHCPIELGSTPTVERRWFVLAAGDLLGVGG